MKKLVTLLAVSFLFTAGLALASSEQSQTWRGEIVDLACYLDHGAKGEEHAGCAKSCVKHGQPMGLLTVDGTVYLLAADHKDGTPFEAVKEFAGQQATVTGTLSDSAGVKMITVKASSQVK